MCLILFAINPNARYRLVVAANRDELFARPTKHANYWESNANVLAGIDQNMGGTWLGVNRRGDFAAVTNFREQLPEPPPPHSRGDLPSNFLIERPDPLAYVEHIRDVGHHYRGFNLIVANTQHCYYVGNRDGEPRQLATGFYGLSNQLLDCDWPKVTDGRERLKELDFDRDDLPEALFSLLRQDGDEREFSNSFIKGDIYGTRAATVVLMSHTGEVYFEERNFDEDSQLVDANQYNFSV